MLMVLSPAKSLDYQSLLSTVDHSIPAFVKQSSDLIQHLKKLHPSEIAVLMKLSDSLAALNYERYQAWRKEFTVENSRPAIFAFDGDVYDGLDVRSFSRDDLSYAQEHLRILSGLYGVLRPLDLMQPYRLEMGTRLATARGKDLYEFWGDKITHYLNQQLKAHSSTMLINLASQEYFRVIKPVELEADIVSPHFKDCKNGQYKIISFFAKKARGMMARWLIQERVQHPDQLQEFNLGGYVYSAVESRPNNPVFLRNAEA